MPLSLAFFSNLFQIDKFLYDDFTIASASVVVFKHNMQKEVSQVGVKMRPTTMKKKLPPFRMNGRHPVLCLQTKIMSMGLCW